MNPDPQNWAEVERSFDEIAPYEINGVDTSAYAERLKQFLHDKLLEAEKRGRNAAVDYIEKKAHIVKTVPISIEVYEQDLKAARESKGADTV